MGIWLKIILQAVKIPFFVAAAGCLVALLLSLASLFYPQWTLLFFLGLSINYFLPLLLIIMASWFSFRVIDALLLQLKNTSGNNAQIVATILPLVKTSLKIVITFFFVNLLLPLFNLPDKYYVIADKALDLALIGSIAWLLLNSAYILGDLLVIRYSYLYTKIHIFKKIVAFIIVMLAFAAALMTFDSVRKLGVSILASAGLISVVLGFAAQKTLGSFFSGIQIALTQPIKIDDTVVLEGETGVIEEITLSYVVVRLWDQRRLVVPINTFLDKPFQNWTRTSTELLGTVFLYVDYLTPVGLLREELKRVLSKSVLWDKRVSTLQVSDCKEHTLEIRILVSAADSNKLWDLRCEVREALINCIRDYYPQSLSKMRIVAEN